MSAVAAPEVPALGALLASMAAALAWVAALGLLTVWRRSLGKMMLYVADQLDRASVSVFHRTVHLFGPISKWLRWTASTVDHYLAEAVIWSERSASVMFRFFLAINLWMAREIADLATDTWHALASVNTTIVRPAVRVLDQKAVARIRALEHSAATTKGALVALITRKVAAAEHRLAGAIAIPAHAIAGVIPRVGRLERRASAQSHRLTKLEKATVGIGAAALVLTALKRLGLGWLRCSNVTRAGKAVCGINPNLLESVLLDVAVLTIALDLRAFTRELQSVTGEAAHLIRSQIK